MNKKKTLIIFPEEEPNMLINKPFLAASKSASVFCGSVFNLETLAYESSKKTNQAGKVTISVPFFFF